MQRLASVAWVVVAAGVLWGCTEGADTSRASAARWRRPRAHSPSRAAPATRVRRRCRALHRMKSWSDGTRLCREGTMTCRSGQLSACEGLRTYAAPEQARAERRGRPGRAAAQLQLVRREVLLDRGPAAHRADDGRWRGLWVERRVCSSPRAWAGQWSQSTAAFRSPAAARSPIAARACRVRPLRATPAERWSPPATSPPARTRSRSTARPWSPVRSTGCMLGACPLDMDCDGIPDALDECTPRDGRNNPACNGSVLPLPTTNNQTIFHVLDQGETGTQLARDRLPGQERRRLLPDGHVGHDARRARQARAVDDAPATSSSARCSRAAARRCSGTAMRTACDNRVRGRQRNQLSRRRRRCTAHGEPALAHCPTSTSTGCPDDDLKDKGVVGAMRCLRRHLVVRRRQLHRDPVRRDGVTYRLPATRPSDHRRRRAIAATRDENAFRHFVDMTRNIDRVKLAIAALQDQPQLRLSRGRMIALLLAAHRRGADVRPPGGQHSARASAPAVPADTFGYPCFRKSAIPIVVLFTDDPMNNGPPLDRRRATRPAAVYDANYTLNRQGADQRLRALHADAGRDVPHRVQPDGVGTDFVAVSATSRTCAATIRPRSPAAARRQPGRMRCIASSSTDAHDRGQVRDERGRRPATATTIRSATATRRRPRPRCPWCLSVYSGVPSNISAEINIGDTRVNPIPTGPDRTYLTFKGTTAGANSQNGVLGRAQRLRRRRQDQRGGLHVPARRPTRDS